jgi:ABC-2 type transport system ATP-binding protein
VIAHGTADELKARVGGQRLEVTVSDPRDLDRTGALLAPLGLTAPVLDPHGRSLSMPVPAGVGLLRAALLRLDEAKVGLDGAGLRQPTLDEVFFILTGHSAGAQRPDGVIRRSDPDVPDDVGARNPVVTCGEKETAR